jgi:hypothetical protein
LLTRHCETCGTEFITPFRHHEDDKEVEHILTLMRKFTCALCGKETLDEDDWLTRKLIVVTDELNRRLTVHAACYQEYCRSNE